MLYGLTAIAMTVGLQELRGIWLFIFATVYATVAEWVSGHLIEKSIQGKMVGLFKYQMEPGWIYLSSGFTVLGCARLSGSEMVQWGHVDFITYSAEASDAYCAADTDRCTFCGYLWFFMLLTGKSKNPERWIATDAGMDKISTKIAGKIAGSLEKRLKKAYPKARKIEEEIREENEEKVFAKRVRLL